MRHSLFARLAGLSVAGAVAAVAATAWLATQTTSARLVGEFSRSLEADAFIYTQLLDHATSHPDWNEVEPLVRELSERTGRRITLVSQAGDMLADSARQPDGTVPTVPDVPAAVVDPFAPLSAVTDDSEAAEAPGAITIQWPPDVEIPAASAERRRALQQVVDCLADGGVTTTVDGIVAYMDGRSAEAEGGPTLDDLEACRALEQVVTPTATEQAIIDQLRTTIDTCLTDADVHAATRIEVLDLVLQGGSRAPTQILLDPISDEPSPIPFGEAGTTAAIDPRVIEQCLEEGYRQVFGEYTAEPALLYLEMPADDGPLANAGGGRLLGAVGAVLVIVVGITLLVGRRLVAPIHDLTGAARRMERGERDARVDVRGHDEVARLGTAFNSMATALQRTEEQRRAMVGDVAHELRSPLTRLRGYLEAAQDGIVNIDEELVASLHEESLLVQRLVEDLQQLALADAGQLHVAPVNVDAAELAAQVVNNHQAAAAATGVELELTVQDMAEVWADPDRLRQALANLVTNALAYTPSGGRVDVAVGPGDDPATLALSVTDTGIGIAPRHLPHVFDRFFRADPSRTRETGGSGLGLAITRSLVEAHGGTVHVDSRLGEGARFTITLPRNPD